jgi:hypothetical protein
MKFAGWFLRKRFLNIFSAFLLFCHYLPLEGVVALHLIIFESPLLKDNLHRKVALKKKLKM